MGLYPMGASPDIAQRPSNWHVRARANTVLAIHLANSTTSKGRESGLKPECLI